MRRFMISLLAGLVLTAGAPDDLVGVDPATARWEIHHRDGTMEVLYFGTPGDLPLIGDWDCDGIDSPGMYRPTTGLVYLRADQGSVATARLFFGEPGDVVLVGDWNGDGCDSLGAYRRRLGRVLIANRLGGGSELEYFFGIPSDQPFVGDFDGNGSDEIGLHRETTGLVYFRYRLNTGFADHQFFYGDPGDQLVAGDWNGDGVDSPGVLRPSTQRTYLRNANTLGVGEQEFEVGGTRPVSGQLRTPPASPPATGGRAFTLAVSGDFLVHAPVAAAARSYGGGTHDFAPMLAPVAARIGAADLAVCHMETPLSPDNANLSSYPIFNAPNELATAIAGAGYDACSTASNHSIDKGERGVMNTLGVLDAAGLRHAGTARGLEEDHFALYPVKGITLAHLSYTYGLNGLKTPAGKDYLVNLIDPAEIVAEAGRARAAGAEFVVVSMHWGAEYRVDPTPEQLAWAEMVLTAPEIDLIVGHHAHVVQPIGKVGDKFVIYGLGNFLSNQRSSTTRVGTEDGVVVEVDVVEEAGRMVAKAVRYTPTFVEEKTFRILPVAAILDDPSTPAGLRSALEQSWARTTERVNRLGTSGVFPTGIPGGGSLSGR